MASARRPSSPRLPRGRHALEADDAAARYRALLHAAAIEVVGEHGYGATTVDALAATAGVSTATLYELFSGKQELVLDTSDAIVGKVGGRLRARTMPEGDLRRALAGVLSAVVDAVLAQPDAARLAVVDIVTIGPPGVQRRRQLTAGLEELLRQAATPNGRTAIPDPALSVVAGGTMAVLDRHLRDGRLRPLRAAALDLATWGAQYETHAPRPGLPPRAAAAPSAPSTPSPSSFPLPRGRHGLPPAFVKRHQRTRILEAVLAVSAQQGFEAASVRDLIAAAGLSHQTFYQHFQSKEDAWSAAFEQAFVELFAAAWYAAAPQPDAAAKVTAAVSACLNHLAAAPQRARLLLVDAPSAGRAATPAIDEATQAFTRLFTRAAGQRAGSAIIPYALVGGIVSLIAGWVIDGRAAELADLTPALVEIIFVPLFGSPAARAAATGLGAADPDTTADDRRVLMDAFAESVARDGLTATRLSDVAQQVGIELDVASTMFVDEIDCATQILDAWAGQLVVIAAGAFLAAANDPPLAAHRALEAALGHLARTPAISALAVTDEPDLVPAIATLQIRYISLFFQLIAGQVPATDQRAPQPLAALEVVLDGIMAVLRRFAREGRVAELPAELPALSLQVLTPFFGADEARRVAALSAASGRPH